MISVIWGKLWQVQCDLRQAAVGEQGIQGQMLEGKQGADYRILGVWSANFLCKQWEAQRSL